MGVSFGEAVTFRDDPAEVEREFCSAAGAGAAFTSPFAKANGEDRSRQRSGGGGGGGEEAKSEPPSAGAAPSWSTLRLDLSSPSAFAEEEVTP